jgi:hypothetical protein
LLETDIDGDLQDIYSIPNYIKDSEDIKPDHRPPPYVKGQTHFHKPCSKRGFCKWCSKDERDGLYHHAEPFDCDKEAIALDVGIRTHIKAYNHVLNGTVAE